MHQRFASLFVHQVFLSLLLLAMFTVFSTVAIRV